MFAEPARRRVYEQLQEAGPATVAELVRPSAWAGPRRLPPRQTPRDRVRRGRRARAGHGRARPAGAAVPDDTREVVATVPDRRYDLLAGVLLDGLADQHPGESAQSSAERAARRRGTELARTGGAAPPRAGPGDTSPSWSGSSTPWGTRPAARATSCCCGTARSTRSERPTRHRCARSTRRSPTGTSAGSSSTRSWRRPCARPRTAAASPSRRGRPLHAVSPEAGQDLTEQDAQVPKISKVWLTPVKPCATGHPVRPVLTAGPSTSTVRPHDRHTR